MRYKRILRKWYALPLAVILGSSVGATLGALVSDSTLGKMVGAASGTVASTIIAIGIEWALDRRATEHDRFARLRLIETLGQRLPAEPLPLGERRPTRLLSPEAGITQFRSRVREIEILLEFCTSDSKARVVILSGPAGVGKSRVISELARSVAPDWQMIRAHPGQEQELIRTLAANDDLCVLVLNASASAPHLAQAIRAFRSHPHLRIAIEARTTGLADELEALTSATIIELNLDVFGSPNDLSRWMSEKIQMYAEYLGSNPIDQLASSTPTSAPMMLLDALSLIYADDSNRRFQPHEVADGLLEQERRLWGSPLDGELESITALRCVAWLTLLRPRDEDRAVAILRVVPQLSDASQERVRNIAHWIADLYPAPGPGKSSRQLSPEILAKALYSRVAQDQIMMSRVQNATLTADEFRNALSALLQLPDPDAATQDLTQILIEATPLMWLPEALTASLFAVDAQRADQVLSDHLNAVPLDTRQIAAALGQIRVSENEFPRSHLALLHQEAGILRNLDDVDNLPRTLLHLAHFADRVAEHQVSLIAIDECIQVLSRKPESTVADLQTLADAYRYQSVALSRLERYSESLHAAEHSLRIWNGLAAKGYEELAIRNIPTALHDVAASQFETGQHNLALRTIEDAIDRQQALKSPSADDANETIEIQSQLARFLLFKAKVFQAANQHQMALPAAQQAVDLYEDLNCRVKRAFAAARGDAGILLAESLIQLGEWPSAVDVTAKVADNLREVDPINSNEMRFRLGRALTLQSSALRESGRYPEALEAVNHAIDALRRPTDQHSATSNDHLADAKLELASVFVKLGQQLNALRHFQEALELYESIDPSDDGPMAEKLRAALRGVSVSSGQLHDLRTSTAATEREIGILRRLVEADPWRYEGELAISLRNLASCYGEARDIRKAKSLLLAAQPIANRAARARPNIYKANAADIKRLIRLFEDIKPDSATDL